MITKLNFTPEDLREKRNRNIYPKVSAILAEFNHFDILLISPLLNIYRKIFGRTFATRQRYGNFNKNFREIPSMVPEYEHFEYLRYQRVSISANSLMTDSCSPPIGSREVCALTQRVYLD